MDKVEQSRQRVQIQDALRIEPGSLKAIAVLSAENAADGEQPHYSHMYWLSRLDWKEIGKPSEKAIHDAVINLFGYGLFELVEVTVMKYPPFPFLPVQHVLVHVETYGVRAQY